MTIEDFFLIVPDYGDKSRFTRAVDHVWFALYPPHTEWWASLFRWCVRTGQRWQGNYRYWRYLRRL